MNQVIFANTLNAEHDSQFDIGFIPTSQIGTPRTDVDTITDKPNEDFIIEYMTPSKTIKTIEVNRETLSIQKIDTFDGLGYGEYFYEIVLDGNAEDGDAVQIIRQDAVPHQRNSWYIELSGNRQESFNKQLKLLSKSELLGIYSLNTDSSAAFYAKYPLTFKGIGFTISFGETSVVKTGYQYIKMLLAKHVQNFGYNHTDDNAELNSGLADYKAWIAGTEDPIVAVYRLRFATNRKASKTRDERVWQNVYICTKGEDNSVASKLDAYMAILNGENSNKTADPNPGT